MGYLGWLACVGYCHVALCLGLWLVVLVWVGCISFGLLIGRVGCGLLGLVCS